jgi:ribonuclease P/MRP protein subunit RPP1
VYEAVTVHPAGESTTARVARRAAEMGFEGVVALAPHGADPGDPRAVADRSGDDVDDGVVIDRDPGTAGGAVASVREDRTVVAVVGGTEARNRFATGDDRVDVLLSPLGPDGDGAFDDALAKRAREHGVRVAVDLGHLLRSRGGDRVRALSAGRRLRDVLVHYDTPHVVTAGARTHLALRAPRELVAAAEVAGHDPDWTRAGLREWGDLAARNRHRLSGAFIEPGVERPGDEEDDR